MLDNVTVEQLEQLERERNATYADEAFQQWMQDLNVSRMWVDTTGHRRAADMMALWDGDAFSRQCRQRSILYRLINP